MATIESFVKPARLYRYRSAKHLQRELTAIREGYLHCAAFEDLNDPMEGLFASSRRLRNSANYQDVKAAIINTKAQIGICSFSEVCDHELMWAHYADQFSGICVGYSLSRMLASLGNDVEFVRMYYDEKVPTISHASAHPTLTAKRVLSYKNYRWLYEREWRMFATQGKAIYGEAACATHIYLGSRMRQVDRELVIESLKDTEIRISEMSIKKYSISFIDV